ncbi:hypothetical protein DIE21_08920 [Burkholderia sp. Bp9140]|uniref:hypothetical protein n=1 Tax=Burkholderia sp. Bp9140 TaxID=2184572 RepID=UPI000F564AEA|nr:hypothetical protein [Burkholderia sp. Bp9140]RQR53868.1 hypothetical protein DIE21_08920 [Burkholderia sp. Bp9140]
MKPVSTVKSPYAFHPFGSGIAWGLLCLPFVLLAAPVRNAIESGMTLQMLTQFPLLMASGFAATALVSRRHAGSHAMDALMRLGLVPLLSTSLCLMFWMVPLALDLARLHADVNAAKYGSLLVAGAALQQGLKRAPAAVLVFFAGNLVWMLATVGMLFYDAETRLCASFLLDDQRLAGIGLVGCAIAITFVLILHLHRLPGYGFSAPD